MDKDRYLVASVRKAGQIMRAIAESKEPMSIAQIIEAVRAAGGDLTQDSAFRMCATLELLGWVTQIGERYELGTGLSLLWARKKATLEAQRIAIDKALDLLGED